jgi:hypothetical protein
MTEPTITTRVDPLAEMRKAINARPLRAKTLASPWLPSMRCLRALPKTSASALCTSLTRPMRRGQCLTVAAAPSITLPTPPERNQSEPNSGGLRTRRHIAPISIAASRQTKSAARTGNDRCSLCPSCCHRHVGHCCMGRPMNHIVAWWRRTPKKAQPPQYVDFAMIGVGGQNCNESVDQHGRARSWRSCLAGAFFEISI